MTYVKYSDGQEPVKGNNKKTLNKKAHSDKNKIFNLLEEERLVVIRPKLASLIGLNEAIILQQIKYWLQRSNHVIEGRNWFYKTNKEWKEELPFLSEMTIRRTVESLEEQGLILTRTSDTNFSRTKYYTLNDHNANTKLDEVPIVQNEQVELFKMNTPIVQNEQLSLIHRVHIENNNNIDLDKSDQENRSPSGTVVVSCYVTKSLTEIGICNEDVDSWLKRFGETKITEKLSFMPPKTKITSSQAAWLREALERDYQPPKNATTAKNGGSSENIEKLYQQRMKEGEEEAERRRLEYIALNAAYTSEPTDVAQIRKIPSAGETREKTIELEARKQVTNKHKMEMKQEQEALKSFSGFEFAGVTS